MPATAQPQRMRICHALTCMRRQNVSNDSDRCFAPSLHMQPKIAFYMLKSKTRKLNGRISTSTLGLVRTPKCFPKLMCWFLLSCTSSSQPGRSKRCSLVDFHGVGQHHLYQAAAILKCSFVDAGTGVWDHMGQVGATRCLASDAVDRVRPLQKCSVPDDDWVGDHHFSLLQPQNASSPMPVTDSKITACVRLLQFRNAESLMPAFADICT